MELGNFLSAKQIDALKAVATAQTDAQIYAAHVSEKAWELLYDIAAALGQQLGKHFWEQLDNALAQSPDVVVFLKGKRECEIASIIRDKRWMQHMGEMLKRGYSVVCFADGEAWQVDWENWKYTYNVFMPQVDNRKYDTQLSRAELLVERRKRDKEREFYELAKPIRSKKGGRMRISFEEARAQRIKQERIDYETKVVSVASKILKAM
jgi:hypothetical protein